MAVIDAVFRSAESGRWETRYSSSWISDTSLLATAAAVKTKVDRGAHINSEKVHLEMINH